MQVSTLARIDWAVAVQTKGEALALYCSTKRLMDRTRSGTLRNEPRRMACSVMMPNHRSTWLIQEA